MQPTHGHLSEGSPRYADWLRVFGSSMVELEDPIGTYALLPGRGRTHIYRLKLSSLTLEQRARLIAYLAAKWNLTLEDVAAGLDDPNHGCPILAEDVSVSFDMRLVI